MISLKDITLHYGAQTVFDAISLNFLPGQRIGIIGRNGAGKSTMLKLIAGQLEADQGSVSIATSCKVAYLPQELLFTSEKTVFDEAMSVFQHELDLHTELATLEAKLSTGIAINESDLERYTLLHQLTASIILADLQNHVHFVLRGLGFTTLTEQKLVAELSVGWKMRLLLAKLLLQKADIYLFDEPTNHLDIQAQRWFFDFLRNSTAGFLLVSHDRYFLDNACSMMVELERGRARVFNGNFTALMTQKEKEFAITQATYNRQEKEIARKEATINRFRASANKARMAQSMIKQLDKIERIEIEPPLPKPSFSFPLAERSGTVVLTLKNIKHHYTENPLFKNVSGIIERGEKIALIAPNGTGKTTLFNLIAQTLELQQGSIIKGHNVLSSLFEQDQHEQLNPTLSVWDEVLHACPTIPASTIRSFLGNFLFSGDSVYKKISVLSGGERNRVALVKVLLQKANFLLLDEPTNHLDLVSKEVLLQALKTFNGTILFVCHDHYFLSAVATKIWELTPTELISFKGTYEDYLSFKRESEKAPTNSTTKIETPLKKKNDTSHHQLRKEIAALEAKIEKREQLIATLSSDFAHHTYGSTDYQKLMKRIEECQNEIKLLYAQWEELEEKI